MSAARVLIVEDEIEWQNLVAELLTDQGHTWSQPRFVLASALAPNLESLWRSYQCSYADLVVDGDDLHLFIPHRWQRVLEIDLKASDLLKLPTRGDLAASAKPESSRPGRLQ